MRKLRGSAIVFWRLYRSQTNRGPARLYWALRNWATMRFGAGFES